MERQDPIMLIIPMKRVYLHESHDIQNQTTIKKKRITIEKENKGVGNIILSLKKSPS